MPNQFGDVSRRNFILTGAVAGSASLAGCFGGENGDGDEEFSVTITQSRMPETLDPHNHFQNAADMVAISAYEGLLSRTPAGEIIPELATEYSLEADGEEIVFTIREDVTFHNGDTLTPEDVAFSINRIVDPEVDIASPQDERISGVEYAEVVEGEHAVRVVSDGPNPIAVNLFGTYCDIVQKSWIESHDDDEIAQGINGTGPFTLESYEEDVEVRLVRYEDHWRDVPEPTEIVYNGTSEESTRVNQLLANETDLVLDVNPGSVSEIEREDGLSIDAVPSVRVVFAAMRTDIEPFSSQQFRQALNYAVDNEGIVENVLDGFGSPMGQPGPDDFTGYNPDIDPYPYDPDEAEALVEESGHADVEIELHAATGYFSQSLEVSQAIVSDIDDLPNVSCELVQREAASLSEEYSSGDITDNPPMHTVSAGNDTFDAGFTVQVILTSDGPLSTYSNDELDELVGEFANEAELERREELMQEASAMVHEQAPWIFLHQEYSLYGSNDEIEWEPTTDEMIRTYDITQS